jgi:DNA-binding response OmpR family regulator
VTIASSLVVLTGSEGDEAEINAMNAGADDYIRKPLEPVRFVARIKAALRRAGS